MQQDFCRISSLNLCESDVESLLRSLKMHSFLKLMFTEHLFFYQITIPACPPCEVKSVEELVAQSCPTLCNPMDCSPPDSSVHGILQARLLEWVAIPFSRESNQMSTTNSTRALGSAENSFSSKLSLPMSCISHSKQSPLSFSLHSKCATSIL